jgi:putative DNA primase/helicase
MVAAVVNLNAWRGQVQVGKQGPLKCLTNLVLYLQNLPEFAGNFRFNELSGLVELGGLPLQDCDYVDIRVIIEKAGYYPDKSDVPIAVERVARDRSYHPIREYLDGLAWDGQARLDGWLTTYLGAADHALMRSFAAKFLIGAVARVFQPGCKMDTVLVLEGAQGLGKTTAVGALFGENYMTSSLEDFGSKEAAISVQGQWVVELAELAALNKSDVLKAKKFITETVDQFRPPYGRHTVRRPRQCVIVGTTNDETYLKDTTGNRRYWPVPVLRIDLAGIRRDRDQIWAEAVDRYKAGEHWWLEDADELKMAEAVQRDRIDDDVWAPQLDELLRHEDYAGDVQVSNLLAGLKMETERRTKAHEMRVAMHLASRGFKKVKKRLGGVPVNVWQRPEA